MISLITGITGFVGSHMTELLLAKKHGVFGISRGLTNNAQSENLKRKITFLSTDILNKKRLEGIIKKVKPDYIFHFAAQSSNLDSFEKPKFTFETNVLGTLNLLDAVHAMPTKPTIIVTGSSEEYGHINQTEIPISEDNQLRPQNPYAVSKIAGSYLSYQYALTYGINVIRVRSFNQEGPGRQARYVISNFAKQIVEIEKGKKKPVIFVGNLDTQRDFLDVRDAVSAYLLLAQKGGRGEVYNVCSMKPRKINDILKILLSLSFAKDVQIFKDKKRMRPSEIPVFYGDNTKVKKATGWKPKIIFEKTLKDTLNYWRETITD